MAAFFFYGLLRRGQPGHAEFRLGERMRFLGTDSIAGSIRDLGEYPGIILGGDARIDGEVYATEDAALTAELDGYEGYDPASPATSEYVRRLVTTLGDRQVWIYEYNPEPDTGGER